MEEKRVVKKIYRAKFEGSRERFRPKLRRMDSVTFVAERKVRNIEDARTWVHDRDMRMVEFDSKHM
jgi:hypothetical protein